MSNCAITMGKLGDVERHGATIVSRGREDYLWDAGIEEVLPASLVPP
jgi:hypothetical protein